MKNKIILLFVTISFFSLVFAMENVNSDELNSFSAEDFSNLSANGTTYVIVVFKNEINETMLKNSGAKIKENFNSIDTSIITADKESIKEIQNNSNVETIEPDINLELFGDGSTVSLDSQIVPWGIDRLNAPKIWNESTGKRIKIAVIDSGINKNHPDLNGNVVGGISFINNTEYWDDESGHGTSVAGVIGAVDNNIGVVGVAPESELYSVKVIGVSGGKLSNFMQGIQWAIDNDMDIVVMSLGIPIDSPSLNKMVDEAYSGGIILVSASGKDNQIYYPAKYSSVIAVGSINENNELTNENGVGEELELVAPGANIISTSNERYSSFDGTSMAAPHVAGVIALLKENNPSLSNNEIRAKLQRDAVDLGSSGKDNYFGYGLVNINLQNKNLSSVIQIVFPDSLNETDFVKVDILKLENEKEEVVQTLFYNANVKIVNVSVEPGNYKVKQYFENNTLEENYTISEGEIIIVPLYGTSYNHQYIIKEAKKIWTTNEITNYISDDETSQSTGNNNDVTEGSYEEDSPITQACKHFWEPDSPQNGIYNAGLNYILCGGQSDSSYVTAQYYWNNYVIPNYPSNKALSYYYLGRVAHLLEDATVPAHMHLDVHATDDDSYEDTMQATLNGKNYWGESQVNYKHFNGLNYAGNYYKYENVYLPSDVKTNPSNLFKLFWYTAQKTQYYASDDVDGNNYYYTESGTKYSFPGGSSNTYLWNSDGVTINPYKSNLVDDDNGDWGNDLKYTAEGNIPHAMKSVAGLYRLFWKETHSDTFCEDGKCCDISQKLFKSLNQQPTGLSDYYFVSGTNSPTGTSYIKLRNYYCGGFSSSETYTDTTADTCGICKYGNNGASSCSNYNTATIYDSTQKCSLKSGESNYNTGGEYLCQEFCNGNGNRRYAGNCAFSVSCASNYLIQPTININTSQKTNLFLVNKVGINIDSNKMAKEIKISLDNALLPLNCSQCNSLSSNLTINEDGKHIINVSILDYVNKTNSSSTVLFIDTKAPVINYQEPINGSYISPTTNTFKLNYSEENVKSLLFYWKAKNDSKFNNFTISSPISGINVLTNISLNLTSFSLGRFDYFFGIVDIANRSTNSSVVNLELLSCINNWTLEDSCDFCKPNVTNTTFTEWKNQTSCLLGDYYIQNQSKTEYDSNFSSCYLITNLTSDLWNNGVNKTYWEFRNQSCDFCTPNISISLTDWQNISCLKNDKMNQSGINTSYDVKQCTNYSTGNLEYANQTITEYKTISCDYCNYSIKTTSTEWQNYSCLITDSMKQKRTNITFDSNYSSCYSVTNLPSDLWNNGQNITIQEFKELGQNSCNYCSEDISQPQYTQWSECSNGIKNRVKYYTDSNYASCCAITNIDSDCSIRNPIYQNVTETSTDECPNLLLINPVEGIYNERGIMFNLSSKNKFAKLVYSDNGGRDSSLCTNCFGYGRKRTLSDGNHILLFRGILPDGKNVTKQTELFIDSKDPQISTTKPSSRKYTNGSNFYIKYSEDNCQTLKIFISGSELFSNSCESGRNIEKTIPLDINLFNGQEVEYRFAIKDIANNTDESRLTKIKVDTTSPEIKNFVAPVIERYIYFNMTILNEDKNSFNKVEYNDNSNSRWNYLCTSLKNNNCYKKVSFKTGNHNLIIKATDEAGNSNTEIINVNIV